jgi:hypothetical protein
MAGSDNLTVQIGLLGKRLLLNLVVLSWAGDGDSGRLVTASPLVWIAICPFLRLASGEAVPRRG